MSQHEYVPVDVDDPDTYSMALLWMNAYAADNAETQRLREELERQYREAGVD